MKWLDALRQVRRSRSGEMPLIEVGISRDNLLHNLHTYQETYPGMGIAPVLKSNAYGHGLLEVAHILDGPGVPFFVVDSWYEARCLRQAGIRRRILVIGYARPKIIARNGLRDIDTAIVDIEQLRELAKLAACSIRLHLKVDTGMHRQGLAPDELDGAARIIASNPMLMVVGICSHFADADTPGSSHVQAQLAVWRDASKTAERLFPRLEYRHIAATAGMAHAEEDLGNVARIGRGIYGYNLAPGHALPLRPALALRTTIVSLRRIKKGASVGYNATHTAERDSLIATVPLGYFEGLDRRFSNHGSMLVGETLAPIIGIVSMNMSSLDVSDIPGVARGDRVIAISRNPASPNALEAIAKRIGAHASEILVHIPAHLRRVID